MSRSSGRYGSALLFILLGLVLLLFTTGYIDWTTVWTVAVPGLFVLLGLWALLASRFRNLTGPVLVVVIAGTVLLQNLDFRDATVDSPPAVLEVLTVFGGLEVKD